MNYINIDFETRSTTDLRKTGVYKYVEDPNTDVWCMAYSCWEHGNVMLWVPGDPFPADMAQALSQGMGIRAWNAQFERLIWNAICVEYYDFPSLDRDRFFCTQADALAMALPAALGKAAEAARLDVEKDMEGNRMAVRMSKPRKINKDGSIIWWDDQGRRLKLYEYCKQDVRTEIAMQEATRRLDPTERELYLLDQRINDRGFRIDLTLAGQCKRIAFEGIQRANRTVMRATEGSVEAITQVGALQYWIREQGVDIPDMKKHTVKKYLDMTLPPNVEQVLIARAEAGKASVAKINKMQDVACVDGFARGLLQYHGAGTGRWAGRLVQPQNLFRPTIKNVEQFIPFIAGSLPYDQLDLLDNPVAIVASLLRSMLVAGEGRRLMSADFSAIECRVLAWLAMQENLLEAFRNGEDVYVTQAAEPWGITRQEGKITILGAGYQMGHKTFVKQAEEQFGLIIELARGKEFIDSYRARFTNIVSYWKESENVLLDAVRAPGSVQMLRDRIKVTFRGRHLWVILPSGRPLCYHFPSIVEVTTPWGEEKEAVEIWGLNGYTKKWEPRTLYGGLIVENVVQAASRDLMAYSMLEVEKQGYPINLTVHDEIVADVPEGFGTFSEYCSLMAQLPSWAVDMPMAVTGWEGKRYRKD